MVAFVTEGCCVYLAEPRELRLVLACRGLVRGPERGRGFGHGRDRKDVVGGGRRGARALGADGACLVRCAPVPARPEGRDHAAAVTAAGHPTLASIAEGRGVAVPALTAALVLEPVVARLAAWRDRGLP